MTSPADPCGVCCGVRPRVAVQKSATMMKNQCFGAGRMAPRVGFEPTTNRLTAGCSTAELPRITVPASNRAAASYQVRRCGERGERKCGPPGLPKENEGAEAPSKALGMVGCLQGKTG